MEAKDALKHWAAWGRDIHSKGSTCTSFERNYINDPERYGWPVDCELAAAFKYDLKIAEKVEQKLVKCLSKTELYVLVCCEVYGHALEYQVIARRIHMTKSALETFRMSALHKFGRNWHG